MRTSRCLALLCAALLPAAASAQSEHEFKDSWFWGVKGGVTSFSTATARNVTAPLVGGEWLITRERFGLYLAVDQSFFEETAELRDRGGVPHVIAIRDLRRFTAAGFAFPKAYGALRPYAGLGLAANFIPKAIPEDGDFPNGETAREFQQVLDDRKDRASVVLILGAQGQAGRVAPFAQATLQPSQVRFLLDQRPTYLFEAGIRLNLGSAIERPD